MKLASRSDTKPPVNAMCTRILMYILNKPAASGWLKVIFRPGSKHANADSLSGRAPTEEELGEMYGETPRPLLDDEVIEEIRPEHFAVDLNTWVYLGALTLGWAPCDTIIELLQREGLGPELVE